MATTSAVPSVRHGKYLFALLQMSRGGVQRCTSDDLSRLIGVNASQVRRDMSAIGRLGRRGVGYPVNTLIRELAGVWGVMVVGDGPVAAMVREQLATLRGAGVWPAQVASRANVVVLDTTDKAAAGIVAELDTAGVPLVVNFGAQLLRSGARTRVVNASPLLTLLTAVE